MAEWLPVLLAFFVLAAGVWLRWLSRRPKYHYKRLAIDLTHLPANPDSREARDFFRRLYRFARSRITAQDAVLAYKAVDLLRTAFASGRIAPEEATRLCALTAEAVKLRQTDIAVQVMGVINLVFRRGKLALLIPDAFGHMAYIAAVGIRGGQGVVASRALENMAAIFSRSDWKGSAETINAAVDAFRLIGIAVLRRKDRELFREVEREFVLCYRRNQNFITAEQLATVITAWIHRTIKNNDRETFETLLGLVEKCLEPGQRAEFYRLLAREWTNLIGIANLNPHNQLAGLMLEEMLQPVLDREAPDWSRELVKAAGDVVKVAVSRYSLEESFPLVLPLLTLGRRLLKRQLRFEHGGAREESGTLLAAVLNEIVGCAEILARKKLIGDAGEVIYDLWRRWTAEPVPQGGPDAARRFCQVVFLYWACRRRSKAQKSFETTAPLFKPMLLKDEELARLNLNWVWADLRREYDLAAPESGTGGKARRLIPVMSGKVDAGSLS